MFEPKTGRVKEEKEELERTMGMIIQFQVCRGPWQHGTYFGGLVSLNSYPSESLGYIIYANSIITDQIITNHCYMVTQVFVFHSCRSVYFFNNYFCNDEIHVNKTFLNQNQIKQDRYGPVSRLL